MTQPPDNQHEPLPCPHGRQPYDGNDGWKTCPHCLRINKIPDNQHERGKYRIAFDYGAYEGLKIEEDKYFATVDKAVKYAVGMNYATPFIIIEIAWKPEGKDY